MAKQNKTNAATIGASLEFGELRELMTTAFYAYGENGREGLPLFFVSAPGESKTSQMRAFMRDCGGFFAPFEGASLDAVDVAGLPTFSADGESFKFVPPVAFANAARQTGPALIALDELTRAPASVQATMLTLFLEGRTQSVQLPPNVRIWAAANPGDQVGGVDMDPANASRVVWVDWPAMSAADWTRYLLGADSVTGEAAGKPIDHAAMMHTLRTQWPAAIMRARGLVAGYMGARGSRLRESVPDTARSWANPRTWSMATRALAACFVHNTSENVKYALVGGAVGHGNAVDLFAWLKQQDLPDAKDVLAGKVALPSDKRRPDQIVACLSECIAIASTTQVTRIWELICDTVDVNFEAAVLGIQAAAARGPEFRPVTNLTMRKVLSNPTVAKVFGNLHEAGIRGDK